jgi:Glycosyltransferase sugar-binding region containing DXD motif
MIPLSSLRLWPSLVLIFFLPSRPIIVVHGTLNASKLLYYEGNDRPVLPEKVPEPMPGANNGTHQKHIPSHIWIAVRNISDARPHHLTGFAKKNANWTIHFCDNEEKDNFMATAFANTSILWAYNVLNPQIGCSKAEIWRLAVLYVYGGMYMDDDATLETRLDDIVAPEDRFIISTEPGVFDDRCYIDSFPLSNHSMTTRFGATAVNKTLFDNKFFVNWAIFASPRHPILVRTMEHAVDLIRREYFGESAIKLHVNDHRGKLLMCATTHPINHSARELILENESRTDLGLKIGKDHFANYGGNMKAWYNDYTVPNQ